MAYIGAHYSQNWTYEKGGTDFQAKLGALLAPGDLQASAAATAEHKWHLQAARLSSAAAAAAAVSRPKGSGNVNDNPYSLKGPAETCIGPHPGFSWVDKHGSPLAIGPPTRDAAMLSFNGGRSGSSSAHTGATSNSTASTNSSTGRGNDYAGMTASQRSMALWERVSPGMLPDTTKTPLATTAEAYVYEPHLLEPVDATHHLKRTDFADYIECKLRHMHHIAAAAKK